MATLVIHILSIGYWTSINASVPSNGFFGQIFLLLYFFPLKNGDFKKIKIGSSRVVCRFNQFLGKKFANFLI